MLNGPFAPWPSYDEEEQLAITKVLRSNRVNYWTGGEGRAFEKEFAEFADSRHAIAVANGTVALELALRGLNLPKGKEVIVTSRTFIASASAIIQAGLIPVFADVDRDSQNISVDTIRQKVTENTCAIICVHLAGWPCDMEAIMAFADTNGFKVIEDCAQAHGATINGKSVGSFADVSAWSFCQDKIMTTAGEGGMVTCNSEALWRDMWAFKDHGKSWSAVYETEHPPGFRWLHDSFGTNWRLTEIQSAVGRIQLRRMPQWLEQRQKNAQRIWDTALTCKGLRVPTVPEAYQHACYKCYVFVEPEKLASGWDRDRIMAAINDAGVPCFSGSCSEVYNEKAFAETDFVPSQPLPVAAELGDTSLMFLVHPTLTETEIDLTCTALFQVMREAVGDVD